MGNAEETEGEETGVDVCLSLLGRRGKRDGQTHLGSFSLDTNEAICRENACLIALKTSLLL